MCYISFESFFMLLNERYDKIVNLYSGRLFKISIKVQITYFYYYKKCFIYNIISKYVMYLLKNEQNLFNIFQKIVIVLKIKQKLIIVEYFRILKIELECIRSFSNDLFIEQINQTLYNHVSQLKKILKVFKKFENPRWYLKVCDLDKFSFKKLRARQT